MSAIDWALIVADPDFQKAGKFDAKLAIDWFKSELTARVEAEVKAAQAKKDREGKRVASIHGVFDDMGKDILPINMVVTGALIALQVPVKEQATEAEVITTYLQDPKNHDFASYAAGPGSGIVRVQDIKGKETAHYKAMKAGDRTKLHYHSEHNAGAPTRGKK